MPAERPTIGWREWVSLPDLGVAAMKAKVDTGARSAALHAFELEVFDKDGLQVARFEIHPVQRSAEGEVVVEAPVVGWRKVRNPGGRLQSRPVISTRIGLGKLFRAEVTLTRRDEMGFRMLLGRQTVRRRFLVDPGRSYLLGEQPPSPKKKVTKKPATRSRGRKE